MSMVVHASSRHKRASSRGAPWASAAASLKPWLIITESSVSLSIFSLKVSKNSVATEIIRTPFSVV